MRWHSAPGTSTHRRADRVSADGSIGFGFGFEPGHSSEDIDATTEHLLELPAQLGAEPQRDADAADCSA
jgi:hypothetical protein